jgi:hypothetical protein
MKAAAAMLADHATVREGLLHVLGGGINRVIRDPLPAPLEAMLALLLQPDSVDDLLKTHNLEVTVKHAGTATSTPVAKAVMTLSTTGSPSGLIGPIPVVVPLQLVPITETGIHRITVNVDGEQVAAVEFEIVKAADQ